MFPNFLPNAFVVAIRFPWQTLKVGDVVLVNHHDYGKMIKRIKTINNAQLPQKMTLEGDNPNSITPEQMGELDKSQVIGKVIYQIKPAKK